MSMIGQGLYFGAVMISMRILNVDIVKNLFLDDYCFVLKNVLISTLQNSLPKKLKGNYEKSLHKAG